ncbi:amidohydrolase family protein [Nonomuraea rubra]|uniref:amidohydrolase family protein n=1 Tax=Nonomuraea rubra TaxID=46180 RepID=UPI003623E764
MLFSEGHVRRGLPLTRIAEVAAANPARAFNLWGRKGALAVGFDADLTVLDPALTRTVTADLLLSGQDHCPFEGVRVTGWPVTTVVGGRVAFHEGKTVGEPSGSYLHR